MDKEQTNESILASHRLGLIGVFKTANYKDIFLNKVNIWASIISLIASVFVWVMNLDTITIIEDVVNTLIAFLPSILGFTIAGFTLMVGFLQSDLLEAITEKPISGNYTLYQKTVGKFAVCVLLQSFALIIGYVFHFVILYSSETQIMFDCFLTPYINGVALLIIWYAFILSFFLVCLVVVNIFNFSQLHHFVIVKKKLDESKQNNKKDA